MKVTLGLPKHMKKKKNENENIFSCLISLAVLEFVKRNKR